GEGRRRDPQRRRPRRCRRSVRDALLLLLAVLLLDGDLVGPGLADLFLLLLAGCDACARIGAGHGRGHERGQPDGDQDRRQKRCDSASPPPLHQIGPYPNTVVLLRRELRTRSATASPVKPTSSRSRAGLPCVT